jgi:hypothetical protein
MSAPASATSRPGRSRTGTYVLVLLVHALAITALWAFGHYFSAS